MSSKVSDTVKTSAFEDNWLERKVTCELEETKRTGSKNAQYRLLCYEQFVNPRVNLFGY
ncbi:hypothetical protein BgiMline_030248, partial [Biomphalaria glabrata]